MDEVWKSLNGIIECGENYSVSSRGRVRNDVTGYIKNGTLGKTGYVYVGIKNKLYSMHRLVALSFILNPENKPQVNHKSGNKAENNVNNLEWVTPSRNIKHACDTGLRVHVKGDNHHMATLTTEDVIEIKKQLMKNTSVKSIARRFNVPVQTISCIKVGRTWKHIEVEGFKPSVDRDIQPKGDNHHMSTLTSEDVVKIKKLLMNRIPVKHIASEFSVPSQTISCIKTGKTWKHVMVDGFKPSTYISPII